MSVWSGIKNAVKNLSGKSKLGWLKGYDDVLTGKDIRGIKKIIKRDMEARPAEKLSKRSRKEIYEELEKNHSDYQKYSAQLEGANKDFLETQENWSSASNMHNDLSKQLEQADLKINEIKKRQDELDEIIKNSPIGPSGLHVPPEGVSPEYMSIMEDLDKTYDLRKELWKKEREANIDLNKSKSRLEVAKDNLDKINENKVERQIDEKYFNKKGKLTREGKKEARRIENEKFAAQQEQQAEARAARDARIRDQYIVKNQENNPKAASKLYNNMADDIKLEFGGTAIDFAGQDVNFVGRDKKIYSRRGNDGFSTLENGEWIKAEADQVHDALQGMHHNFFENYSDAENFRNQAARKAALLRKADELAKTGAGKSEASEEVVKQAGFFAQHPVITAGVALAGVYGIYHTMNDDGY